MDKLSKMLVDYNYLLEMLKENMSEEEIEDFVDNVDAIGVMNALTEED